MPIKWYTLKTLYVDIYTGEEIRKEDLEEYILIRSDRTVKLNDTQKFGTIQHIMKCTAKRQLKLDL